MGGHCLPVDPFYLTWKAREYDLATEFIELAGKVNAADAVLLRREDRAGAQRRRASRSAARASLVLGVSYKPGVGDIRESPALKIIELLQARGADVRLPRPARRPSCPRSGSRNATLDGAASTAPTSP